MNCVASKREYFAQLQQHAEVLMILANKNTAAVREVQMTNEYETLLK
jgi:hypothetical protein